MEADGAPPPSVVKYQVLAPPAYTISTIKVFPTHIFNDRRDLRCHMHSSRQSRRVKARTKRMEVYDLSPSS